MYDLEIGVDTSTTTPHPDFDDHPDHEFDDDNVPESSHELDSWKVADMYQRLLQIRDQCGYRLLDGPDGLIELENLLLTSFQESTIR